MFHLIKEKPVLTSEDIIHIKKASIDAEKVQPTVRSQPPTAGIDITEEKENENIHHLKPMNILKNKHWKIMRSMIRRSFEAMNDFDADIRVAEEGKSMKRKRRRINIQPLTHHSNQSFSPTLMSKVSERTFNPPT